MTKRLLLLALSAALCSCANRDARNNQDPDSKLVEPSEAPFAIDEGPSLDNDSDCLDMACANQVVD